MTDTLKICGSEFFHREHSFPHHQAYFRTCSGLEAITSTKLLEKLLTWEGKDSTSWKSDCFSRCSVKPMTIYSDSNRDRNPYMYKWAENVSFKNVDSKTIVYAQEMFQMLRDNLRCGWNDHCVALA